MFIYDIKLPEAVRSKIHPTDGVDGMKKSLQHCRLIAEYDDSYQIYSVIDAQRVMEVHLTHDFKEKKYEEIKLPDRNPGDICKIEQNQNYLALFISEGQADQGGKKTVDVFKKKFNNGKIEYVKLLSKEVKDYISFALVLTSNNKLIFRYDENEIHMYDLGTAL